MAHMLLRRRKKYDEKHKDAPVYVAGSIGSYGSSAGRMRLWHGSQGRMLGIVQ